MLTIPQNIAESHFVVVFANEDSIRKTVATATAEQKSFLQKMVDYLKDFIKSIKKLIDLYGDSDKTVRAAVTTPTEQLQNIADTFEAVLRKTAETKKPATETGGVKFSLRVTPTTDELNENIKIVSKMKPVSFLTGNEFQKGNEDLITQVEKYFDSVGGKVSTTYGDVELRRKGIKSSLGHGIGRNKAVAFKAVPEVLKNGKIIDYQKNWKNRGYDTVVFAAPLSIAGQEYFMASVVVVEATKNAFYLHEVLLQKKEDEALFKTGTAKSGTSGKASSPIFILLEKLNEVKKKDAAKITDDISQPETDVKTKHSRQLLDYVEDSVDQLKAENYSFGEYVDKLTAEINAKISGKRSPGSSTIFNREEFINIAKKYNTFYKKNENGGYNQLRYSDSEIANAIERVLVDISEGVIDAKKGVTLLARMQVDILSDGYVVEDDAKAKEFRQFVRNKPIYLLPRDFAELVDAHGGSKKTLRAASFHQLSFKEAEDGQRADIGVFYETARKLFPEFLKEVITPIEMAEELINAEKSLRPTVHYASEQLGFSGELEMREAAIRRAADILREAFNAETVQGDFTEQYKELITARKSYDKLRQYNKKLLENASKSYYEVEKKETTYKRIIRNAKRLNNKFCSRVKKLCC